jgi:hypothetical protein
MKTTIKYNLVCSLIGNNANSYQPESFDSIEEAFNCWESEYKNRDKKDGHDEYWRKTPFRVQQVITSNLWDMDGQTLVTVVKKDKLSIIKWFSQLKKQSAL